MPDVTHCIVMGGVPGYDLWSANAFKNQGLGYKIWANYLNLAQFGWGWLRLDDAGDNPHPTEGVRMVSTGPIYGYYSPLSRGLRQHGWTIISPDIDWRLKLEVIGPHLVDFLVFWKSKWPLVAVVHSAGGLFLRFALKWLNLQYPTEDVFYKIVSLDAPHWGSWFATGSLTGHLGYTTFQVDLTKQAWLPINTKGKTLEAYIRDVATSFPSVYQMLPCPGAPGLAKADSDQLYNPDTWTAAGNPVNGTLLTYAKNEWATIPKTWSGPPWLAITSTGLNTPVGMQNWKLLGNPEGLKYDNTGDRVIPREWMAIPGMQTGFYEKKDHDQVAQDADVVEACNNFFNSH